MNNYLDTKENLIKIKEAIEPVLEAIKSGAINPGTNFMFEVHEEDGNRFIDRDKPCCTMGHLLKTAGLETEITSYDNERNPNLLFGDIDVAHGVYQLFTANDSTHEDDNKRTAEIVHNLELLDGYIKETLERL